MIADTLDALAQLSRRLDAALPSAARQADAGRLRALTAGLPGLIADFAPALTEVRQRLATLDAEGRAALTKALRPGAGPANAGRAGAIAPTLVAFLISPRLKDTPADLVAIYLLLWLIDTLIVIEYSAEDIPFELNDPPATYWYPRVDTAGTHVYFTGGSYLVNTIPAATDSAYYNAEIYNSTKTTQMPKNLIVNLFPVDDPKDYKHFLYDLLLNVPFVPGNGLRFSASVKADHLKGGSRGWGFWNTCALPFSMQIAWFIQLDGKAQHGVEPLFKSGFYAITQNGLSELPSTIQLPDLDEKWHDYGIEITATSVEYFIDGKSVALVTNPDNVPSAPMAFHNWVDNAVYGLSDGLAVHLLQATTAPRSNTMRGLVIRSMSGGGMARTSR